MDQDDLHTLIIYQNRYFEILNEFFVSVTGKQPNEFAQLDSFSEAVNRMPDNIRGNIRRQVEIQNSYALLENNLKTLYSSEGADAFASAQRLDACKLNLGGGRSFKNTQLGATRRSLLFSDTVLIPDPVMPWIEKKRDEEKFHHVIPLEMAFFVLHLSDLLESEFDIPPFFIFPSWEKTLEENDPQTQSNSMQLIVDVFSTYVDSGIQNWEDVLEFGDKYPDLFLNKVENATLFISPGGDIGESLKNAIENYKNEMRTWRSEAWCNKILSMNDVKVVTNAICERIQPHYHLLENSDELRSHPFLCIEAQAHYYQLIANMKNNRASDAVSFDPSTMSILKSLTSKKLDFLANINDSQIVHLRKTKENISFRRELRDLINSLPSTKLDDLGYVASEVCSHIEMSISKHEKQINGINKKYAAKHKYTALIGAGTLGVSMFPVLAPFLGALLPLGLTSTIGKYASDKLDETAENKQFSHSMMGVFALAKSKVR
ncbi:hypothetical protein PJI16_06330 [Nitrospira sp. MA-1]|nr:hypothetical protein [Nitrospira sp. MA-1]